MSFNPYKYSTDKAIASPTANNDSKASEAFLAFLDKNGDDEEDSDIGGEAQEICPIKYTCPETQTE